MNTSLIWKREVFGSSQGGLILSFWNILEEVARNTIFLHHKTNKNLAFKSSFLINNIQQKGKVIEHQYDNIKQESQV